MTTNIIKLEITENLELSDLVDRGLTGIINMGNTCYMNTMIQVLSNIPDFTLYFLKGKFKEDCSVEKKEFAMAKDYYRVLNGMWEENCIVRPTSFKKTFATLNPLFRGWGQHDCQEALSSLIEMLHNALSYSVTIETMGDIKNKKDKLEIASINRWKEFYAKEYSKIVELFYGQEHTLIKCHKCGDIAHKFDPFCTITLPIPNQDNLTINDCLKEYIKEEKLNKDIFRVCEKCGSVKDSVKCTTFWRLPTYLIISFKRFTSNMRKINYFIKFPIHKFDLNPFITGYRNAAKTYDLVCIANHSGGVGGGHYYAFCKNLNGKWYNFNDATVTEIDESNLITPAAYVLVYKLS